MDHLFRQLTATLTQAQQAVEDELAVLAKEQAVDPDRLAHLGKSVGEFSYEADNLLVMMLERDADDDLLNVAEALVDFFRHAHERIAAQTESGPG